MWAQLVAHQTDKAQVPGSYLASVTVKIKKDRKGYHAQLYTFLGLKNISNWRRSKNFTFREILSRPPYTEETQSGNSYYIDKKGKTYCSTFLLRN